MVVVFWVQGKKEWLKHHHHHQVIISWTDDQKLINAAQFCHISGFDHLDLIFLLFSLLIPSFLSLLVFITPEPSIYHLSLGPNNRASSGQVPIVWHSFISNLISSDYLNPDQTRPGRTRPGVLIEISGTLSRGSHLESIVRDSIFE